MHIRHPGRSLVVHAPAKVNLFLEILEKRPDGYHELETLMVSVGLYDTLRFREERSETIRLRVFNAGIRRTGESLAYSVSQTDKSRPVLNGADRGLSSGRDNLVMRAADLLREAAAAGDRPESRRGVCIDLFKRIPAAAGLGGGSSDAAATLWALNRWWNLKLPGSELQRLAARLGSDVGFFLGGTSAALCRGRGEHIEPLALPLGLHWVIGCPAEGLSTASVYGRCQPAERPRAIGPLVGLLRKGRWGAAGRELFNALQSPAERLNPEVRRLREAFSKEPVLGHIMSGSGSAYFGLCADRRQAQSVAGRIRAQTQAAVYVVPHRP